MKNIIIQLEDENVKYALFFDMQNYQTSKFLRTNLFNDIRSISSIYSSIVDVGIQGMSENEKKLI
jgi:hypothetical protein